MTRARRSAWRLPVRLPAVFPEDVAGGAALVLLLWLALVLPGPV